MLIEPRYCSLAGCVCVACVQLDDGCSTCELLHPELLEEDPDRVEYLI